MNMQYLQAIRKAIHIGTTSETLWPKVFVLIGV